MKKHTQDLMDEYSTKAAEESLKRSTLPVVQRQAEMHQPKAQRVMRAEAGSREQIKDRKQLYELLGPLAAQLGIKVSSIGGGKRKKA